MRYLLLFLGSLQFTLFSQNWVPFAGVEISTTNLKTKYFSNGDEILESKTSQDWIEKIAEKIPAFCQYNNDTTLGSRYGYIYNWFAIADPRFLAPEGTRIMNYSDWDTISSLALDLTQRNYQKISVAGTMFKGKNTWNMNSGEDWFGFNILAGGFKNSKGQSVGAGNETGIWVLNEDNIGRLTPGNAIRAPYVLFQDTNRDALLKDEYMRSGHYVRLVKD